jgi:DNA ligase-associated metallophosphoesterase
MRTMNNLQRQASDPDAPRALEAANAFRVDWCGEEFVLLADRAIWWARTQTICVADVHLGKAAAFRSGGVPVPEQTTVADLDRLSALVSRFRPRRLVVLGDLLHARSGRVDVTMDAFGAWRAHHRELEVLLVRGNHDRSAGDPPREWNVCVVDEPHAGAGDGRILLAHDPDVAPTCIEDHRGMLCGHIHPGVTMFGAVRTLRAKCFWLRPRVGVLPAFGSFTGGKSIRPVCGDRVFAVGPDGVHEVVMVPR